MRARTVLAVVGAAVAAFTVVTLVALEGKEVVVVRTFDEHGAPRETRTWVADAQGYAWVEAANPDRPFLHDIQRNPEIEMRRAGAVQHCQAVVVANPDGHQRIRGLLAAKYGWADRWIGALTDTTGSLALRLACQQTRR